MFYDSIDLFNLSEPKVALLQFTWNNNWIKKYESPWSIVEKFRYANNASEIDIINIIGYPKNRQTNSKKQDFNVLKGLDLDKFENLFGQLITDHFKHDLTELVGFLSTFRRNIFMRDVLHYCPKCLSKGHHSIFHQIKLWDRCVYHDVPLQNSCPVCKNQYSYSLKFKTFQKPFICKCGYSYIEDDTSYCFMRNWTNEPLNILHSNTNTWLALTTRDKKEISQIYFNEMSLDKYGGLLIERFNKINNYFAEKGRGRSSSTKFVLRTPPTKDNNVSTIAYTNNVYQTIGKQIFRSISKRIKYKYIDNEKLGFIIEQKFKQNTQSNSNLCLLSSAYVIWVKNIQDLDDYTDLNARWKNKKWERTFSTLDSMFNSVVIEDIFYMLEKRLGKFKIESAPMFNWMFSKVFGLYLMAYLRHIYKTICKNHRNELASGKDHEKIEEILNQTVEPNHPFYCFKFDQNQIEFHWWETR
jgi:hypothetical protein